MGYTDKELQMATQIAYMNVTAEEINSYFQEHQRYPDLYYLLNESEHKDDIYYDFMKKFPEKPSGKELLRKEASKELLDSIRNGSSILSGYRISAVDDDNKKSGMYACLIETSDHEAIAAFRRSESTDAAQKGKDWAEADFGLLNNETTKQQETARVFLEKIFVNMAYDKYTSLAVTGHSLGGNLAVYASVTCNKNLYQRLERTVSFDGPGFSTEFLNGRYQKNIEERSRDMFHYQWSFVGELLYQLPHGTNEHIYTTESVYGNTDMDSLVQKHDTCFIDFNEEGAVRFGAEPDEFAKTLGELTRTIDAATKTKLPVKQISSLIQKLGGTAEDIDSEKKMVGNLITQAAVGCPEVKAAVLLVPVIEALIKDTSKDAVLGRKILPGLFEAIELGVKFHKIEKRFQSDSVLADDLNTLYSLWVNTANTVKLSDSETKE